MEDPKKPGRPVLTPMTSIRQEPKKMTIRTTPVKPSIGAARPPTTPIPAKAVASAGFPGKRPDRQKPEPKVARRSIRDEMVAKIEEAQASGNARALQKAIKAGVDFGLDHPLVRAEIRQQRQKKRRTPSHERYERVECPVTDMRRGRLVEVVCRRQANPLPEPIHRIAQGKPIDPPKAKAASATGFTDAPDARESILVFEDFSILMAFTYPVVKKISGGQFLHQRWIFALILVPTDELESSWKIEPHEILWDEWTSSTLEATTSVEPEEKVSTSESPQAPIATA